MDRGHSAFIELMWAGVAMIVVVFGVILFDLFGAVGLAAAVLMVLALVWVFYRVELSRFTPN